MKTLVVANQKGGVGKTTLLVHMAHYAAEAGNRVLVVDLDSQCNTSSSLEAFASEVVASALFGPQSIDLKQAPEHRITLIRADDALLNVDRARLDATQVFGEHVRHLADSGRFDLCLIDTAPALGLRMVAAVTAANYVLSPIELEAYSTDGIASMLKTIYGIRQKLNPGLQFLGMLPSRVNTHSPAQKVNLVDLLRRYPDLVVRKGITQRSTTGEAASARKPVWAIHKTSARDAGQEMKAVLAHIIEKMGDFLMALDLSSLDDISALIRGQDTGKGIREVRVDAIQPDPNQPRKAFDEGALAELAESIQSVGIIQPPVVRTHDGGYLLISGERRWRAARQLGWEKIDVIVRDDLNAHAQLVENIQREALSPWEIYRVIAAELDAGTTQVDLARALGKSRAWVTAYAAIDKMPESLVTALRERRITGVTDLSQLHRLLEEAPSDAARLLSSPGQISRSMIEKARREVATDRVSPTTDTASSHKPVEAEATEPVAPPRLRIDVQADNAPTPSLDSGRKSLPVRIRVHYENACWVVDYTKQCEVDGAASVRLEDDDGNSCFAPIEVLRLQSIEHI